MVVVFNAQSTMMVVSGQTVFMSSVLGKVTRGVRMYKITDCSKPPIINVIHTCFKSRASADELTLSSAL